MTYPGSNRTLTYTIDLAGRTSAVSGSISSGSPTLYGTVTAFAPQGAIQTLSLNNNLTNPLIETTSFNARLQPLSIATTQGSTNMLTLVYNYCADFSDTSYSVTCASNNGNMTRQQIGFGPIASAPAFAETQEYQYNDPANRLTQASGAPTPTASANWVEPNGFDAVGNRWVVASGVTGITLAPDTPVASSWFTAQNRINSWNYDAMGNLTGSLPTGSPAVPSRTFVYDGENRQVQATINGAVSTYAYDGDGRRVTAVTPNGTTTFVYDAEGQLAQEYSTAAPSANGPTYLTVDHLGSTRMVTDANGNVLKRYDYLPFGEELTAGTDGRTTQMMYNTGLSATLQDVEQMKFTSKERDSETGLDYFGVRYMSSAQGRFTSPDPLVWQSWQNGNKEEQAKFQEFISDPQNFNLYTYGRNNPLKYTDPTGLDVEIAISFVGDVSDEEKKRIIGAVRTYLENQKVGNVVVRDAGDSSQDKRTFGQKFKDLFTTDFHSITIDFAHPNPFGNDADRPDFVKAANMTRTGDDNFGDLRTSDPTQWSNIVAWRVLHESISHAFGIGPDSDQLIKVGGDRAGTLIEGAYGRGRPGIPGLNPADTRALQNLLVPRTRKYVP